MNNEIITVGHIPASNFLKNRGWVCHHAPGGGELWSKNGGKLYYIYEALPKEIIDFNSSHEKSKADLGVCMGKDKCTGECFK